MQVDNGYIYVSTDTGEIYRRYIENPVKYEWELVGKFIK